MRASILCIVALPSAIACTAIRDNPAAQEKTPYSATAVIAAWSRTGGFDLTLPQVSVATGRTGIPVPLLLDTPPAERVDQARSDFPRELAVDLAALCAGAASAATNALRATACNGGVVRSLCIRPFDPMVSRVSAPAQAVSVPEWEHDYAVRIATPIPACPDVSIPVQAPIDFGTVTQARTPSAPRTITIHGGTTPLTVGVVSVPRGFGVLNDHCSSRTLATGGICTIDVTVTIPPDTVAPIVQGMLAFPILSGSRAVGTMTLSMQATRRSGDLAVHPRTPTACFDPTTRQVTLDLADVTPGVGVTLLSETTSGTQVAIVSQPPNGTAYYGDSGDAATAHSISIRSNAFGATTRLTIVTNSTTVVGSMPVSSIVFPPMTQPPIGDCP